MVARELADAGHRVDVFERRQHVAGNCHTERVDGVLVHRFGPHIFHTSNPTVWCYVNRHAEMMPYRLQVRATVGGEVFSMPINLHTINQVWRSKLHPRQAVELLASQLDEIEQPANFEEAALATIGERLYRMFFEGYTEKQWGRHPSEIPASVFRRLPVRCSYDDSYFDHRWQAIPRHGYTELVRSVLDHSNIGVHLGTEYPSCDEFDHTIWTGPLDAFFDHRHGRLGYRSLRFRSFTTVGDYQGTALMTYPDRAVAFTRITEHKHFAPWENHDRTVVTREYSHETGPNDEPFYPIRSEPDMAKLHAYLGDAGRSVGDVTFVGRLATYRYLDMDVTIADALHAAGRILGAIVARQPFPSLTHMEVPR